MKYHGVLKVRNKIHVVKYEKKIQNHRQNKHLQELHLQDHTLLQAVAGTEKKIGKFEKNILFKKNHSTYGCRQLKIIRVIILHLAK